MPATSQAQQRFMGMVLARKRGKRVGSARVAKAAASMTEESAKEFVSTKRKRLPKKTAREKYKSMLKKSR